MGNWSNRPSEAFGILIVAPRGAICILFGSLKLSFGSFNLSFDVPSHQWQRVYCVQATVYRPRRWQPKVAVVPLINRGSVDVLTTRFACALYLSLSLYLS